MFDRITIFGSFVIAAISMAPSNAHSVYWCIQEHLNESLEYTKNFQPIPVPQWQKQINTVANALRIQGSIIPIPCEHGKKVIAYAEKDQNSSGIPAGEFIIYDPNWVREVVGTNKHELHFLIGHELGHFSLRHFHGRSNLSRKEKETEADGEGACAVAKLGGDWHSVEAFLKRLRTDGTPDYPNATESIKYSKSKFVECGGVTDDICKKDYWDLTCPHGHNYDWVVDLQLFLVDYLIDSVNIRTLEVRTNTSGSPIARLNPENSYAFEEPSEVNIQVRRLKKIDAPVEFGLMDFAAFSRSNIEVKAAAINSLYTTYEESTGDIEGIFEYLVKNGDINTSSLKINASISKSLTENAWSIVSRLPELSSPIDPGDSVVFISDILYEIDPEKYFLSTQLEQWGATSTYPMRNSIYLFSTSENSNQIRNNSFRAFTLSKNGGSDDDGFKVISNNSKSQAVVFHKGIPASTAVMIEYTWAQ